jgi:hypothetical protein
VPRKIVSQYAVFHNIGGTSSVNVYYQDGGSDTITDLSVGEAGYIVDLLRNEKPLAYDPATRRLTSWNAEPAGEGE